jgi:hypothetical protein
MAKISAQCKLCDKKKEFIDNKDITFSKWKIIGWNVSNGQPIVICDKCEIKYG